jgi:hypothetical protein
MFASIVSLVPGSVGTQTITMPTEMLFEIVNALRDGCGCNNCEVNANFLMVNRNGGN